MKPLHPVRLLTAFIAAFCLLFAQLAVAAYVCPVNEAPQVSSHRMAAPCPGHCKDMDKQQPSLCHAHGHPSDSSTDWTPSPPVAPFVATSVFVIAPATPLAASAAANPLPAPVLAYATEPPAAIRHCCFRI